MHQSVMSLPSQLPKVAGQRDDLNITIEKPAQFDHKVAGNGPLGSIADAQGQAAFAQLLAEHDTIQVETADGSWAQNFILPEGEAFHGKRVTFTSYAGYNSFITYSTGTDTLSAGNEFTYKTRRVSGSPNRTLISKTWRTAIKRTPRFCQQKRYSQA
ncbi:hypothetical protein JCM19237_780 [Photobacterium aphoticum]|uniref:Metalloprotease StcE beta-sandwich domain-containing protein n=1 Tax=Photobacterium aphoticum TaxID=754436 RepID=A0A090RM34_9GAMM|nr:hypothetical protein JCM19237_780 [Photobacterium aphoticum]